MHCVSLLAPIEVHAEQRAVGGEFGIVEEFLFRFTPSQRSKCVEGHLRRTDFERERVKENRISVGVLQFNWGAKTVANLQVHGSNRLPIPDQVLRRQRTVLFRNLATQLRPQCDDFRFSAGRNRDRSHSAKGNHARQRTELTIKDVSNAYALRSLMLFNLSLAADQDVAQQHAVPRIAAEHLVEADGLYDAELKNQPF